MKTIRNVLAITLLAFSPLMISHASPLFDGTSSNVWIMDNDTGKTVAGFSLPNSAMDWSVAINPVFFPSTAVITFESGATDVIGSLQLNSQVLMINQAEQSFPTLSSSLPAISLVGLDQGLSDLANPAKPSISVYPEQGSYTSTIAVRLEAVSGRNNTKKLQINWTVNGGTPQKVTSTEAAEEGLQHTIYLTANGSYTISYSVRQGSSSTSFKTITYTLAATDPLRDTDGDGIPDQWESANGMNPLTNDYNLDSDGDGWTDFEELIRGSDPYDATDTPVDSDGDGWSDFDETVRGTNPNDTLGTPYPDMPTARRLHEVEYLLAGSIYTDLSETNKQMTMSQFTVMDVNGDMLYDQASLPTAEELAVEMPPLTEAQIPQRLRRTVSEAALATGDLPTGLRLPASEVAIIRSRHLDVLGEVDKWVVKTWLDNIADLHPQEVTAWLASSANTWSTADEWQTGYQNYLSANLVQNSSKNLSPKTGLGTALVEGLVSWYADLSEGATILLGNTESLDARAAVDNLRQDLSIEGRSLNDLHQELTALTVAGLELSGFANSVSGFYADTTSFTENTTTRAAASLVQGSRADPLVSYVSRLLSFNKLSVIDALPGVQRAILMDPLQDYDADGVLNGVELDATIDTFSDPLNTDSDGDTLPDNIDPCVADANNLCLSLTHQQNDNDGDGVINAVDNCVNLSNINQLDSNNDGIGDACREYANILSPTTDTTIWVGQSVNFTSVLTDLVATSIQYNWDFVGGAANSNLANPGQVRFDVPGNYRISLTAINTATGLPANGDDFRMIYVIGSGPGVNAGGPYDLFVEGQTVTFTALATTPTGSIVSYQWNFGDGNTGAGNPVNHIYAQNGNYVVQVTVADSNGLNASNTASATVADTGPLASMMVDNRSGVAPFTVNFSDTSSAFDGLVSWSWDFGDASALDTNQSTSHTFISRGVYTSTLQVTDGDGSVASDILDILVSSGFMLLADSDNNGIADVWSCGGAGVCIASNDDDSDGFNNIDEYRADTDPGDTADKPEGAAPLSYVLFRDDFDDANYNDRWSVGLMSAAATTTTILESSSRLTAGLLQPSYAGESCSTFSMVSFVTASANNFITHVRNRLEGNGAICTVLTNDESLDNSVEACAIPDGAGNFNVELRSYDADVLTAVQGITTLSQSSDVDWYVLKRGTTFELYTLVSGDALPTLQGSVSNSGIGDNSLRPLLKLESCNTDLGGANANFDLIEILLDRDGDGLADMREDENSNGGVDATESDPLNPDSDTDGVLDGYDNCLLQPNVTQLDSNGDGYGNLCDGDLNNDGRTNTLDLNLYKQSHRTSLGGNNYNPDADFNGDNRINTLDLNIYKGLHRKTPGPSGVTP